MDKQISQILERDLQEDFIRAFCDKVAGLYNKTYDDLRTPPGAISSRRSPELDVLDLQAARRARRANGMRALLETSEQMGVPFETKFLACNGQKLVVTQLGQVLLIAEPIEHLKDKLETAHYKQELAASHFAIRQLELDLGEPYRPRIDARNTMLVVLQHGMNSSSFSRRDTALNMMRLVVPDASFQSLLWEANILNDELALLLDWRETTAAPVQRQEDSVRVTLKPSAFQKERR